MDEVQPLSFLWEWYHYPLLIVVGFVVGFINTVAGGGSLLSLPVLIFLGLPSNEANGTNRVAIVLQTALGTAGFKSKGVSTTPFNIYLGVAALFGALIGSTLAVDIHADTFNKILAIIMVLVAVIIVFKPNMRLDQLNERLQGKYLWIALPVFFLFGIYGGFINAGIGFIIVLFLHNFNRMTLVRANATKVTVELIYNFAALLVFLLNGVVMWKIGLIMAMGNASGAWFGSRISVDKGDGFIRFFLVAMVMVMAIKLWFY